MAHEFPADVVKTTDKFSAELRQFDGISVDDIALLWKGMKCFSQAPIVSRSVLTLFSVHHSKCCCARCRGISIRESLLEDMGECYYSTDSDW
jgi:hypothetical protein